MQKSSLKNGFSLTELIAAISIIVIVGSVSLVSIKALMDSYNSGDNAQSMIKAALSNARAIASKEGTYAGVRFQREFTSGGIENASQYMIFVKYVPPKQIDSNDGDLYIAVEGKKIIRLPDSIALMSLDGVASDTDIDEVEELVNALTFTVVFSPNGNVMFDEVETCNHDGEVWPNDPTESNDKVFNSVINCSNGVGKFIQDKGATSYGLGQEDSVQGFVIVDREAFEKIDENDRWTDFLGKQFEDSSNDPINRIYLNSYTGDLISD